MARNKPSVEVGFDYGRALLRISHRLTYSQIGEFVGYEPSSIGRIIAGQQIPAHPQGEAIWSLYVELFGEKPLFQALDIPYPVLSIST